MTLFLQSNVDSKSKNLADDIGQLVTYYSCDALPTAPPSHACAFETLFFLLIQMVGGIIVFLRRTISILSLYFNTHLCGHFSVRAEEYFSNPTLDVRNACRNNIKNRESILIVHLGDHNSTTSHLYQSKQ